MLMSPVIFEFPTALSIHLTNNKVFLQVISECSYHIGVFIYLLFVQLFVSVFVHQTAYHHAKGEDCGELFSGREDEDRGSVQGRPQPEVEGGPALREDGDGRAQVREIESLTS